MPSDAGPYVFNDLVKDGKEDQVKYYFDQMLTHSSDSFDGKVTNDLFSKENAYQGQMVYVIGEDDVVVPPSLAESMIGKIDAIVENRVKTIRIQNAGHAMLVSRPDVVVNVIEDVVAELQKASAK